jgi:regulator of protease activity HflC (stomatin/prohibitin superfamily)
VAWLAGVTGSVCVTTVGIALLVNMVSLLVTWGPPAAPIPLAVGGGLCLVATGLAEIAARYLADVPARDVPEAPGLTRLARVLGGVLVLAALSLVLSWGGQQGALAVVRGLILVVNGALSYGLAGPRAVTSDTEVPLDFAALAILGSRSNVLASLLDAAERQLGIDLRSTWALTVIRRSTEPLLIGLALLGWLSTSLTRVGLQEEGLVERFGVPSGEPLPPGLHAHLPWPIDNVFRVPALRVQTLTVGHEGAEEGGPEDVLWARQHAANEYTLVLGNGRELITVDAAVKYRIKDSKAWRYRCQNPDQALTAIAYRAVMRNTVDRTLADALSQNLVSLTAQMRRMVQADADALDLGVEVVDFTVGGMHPPVPVAADYQAVVSAELQKLTAEVEAHAYRNQVVPSAEASVVASANRARAEAATDRGKAAGEAWAFRALEAEYRVAPADYVFRRRLEGLESGLHGRSTTIVDERIQKDGGELWLTP